MAFPITTISMSAVTYQLMSNTANELHYTSFNDLLKFMLTLASNDQFIDESYLTDAKNQMASYHYISKMIGLKNQKISVHVRIDPALKPLGDDTHLLAALLFLNVTDFEPTAVFNLTEDEINHMMKSHRLTADQ
jgi:hypothetical protein